MSQGKNKFVWFMFGVLRKIDDTDDKYLFVHNDEGQRRRMSKQKYKSSYKRLLPKLESLKGQRVFLRTSQNSLEWDENDWFSGVEKDNGTKSFTAKPISSPHVEYIQYNNGGCEVCGGMGYVSNDWDGPCFVCGRSSPDGEMGYF